MAYDSRSQPYLPSTPSDYFIAGIAVGSLIAPTIFAYSMLEDKWQSRPLDLPHISRPCSNLRRPPIHTASVGFFRATVEKRPADIAQANQDPVEMDT